MTLEGEGSGPLFDGGFAADVRRAKIEVETQLAEEAMQAVRTRLDVVLQRPTGFYRSRVRVTKNQHGAVVSDTGVVYGPWLEGVSSRNRTTRFKGYHTFRRVFAEMDRTAGPFSQRVLDRYIR